MATFLQPSLSGGELTPGLRGRVDLTRYAISLGKSRNFITKNTGGGVKRPGQKFRGRAKYGDRFTRLIPFIFNTDLKYMIEAGDLYMRFWINGNLVINSTVLIQTILNTNPARVNAIAHGFQTGNHVLIQGVSGMDKLNDRTFQITVVDPNNFTLNGADGTTLPPFVFTGTGIVSRIVEIATPYSQTMLPDVRLTQSADILYLTHQNVAPQELRRVANDSFVLVPFDFRRGPFKPFNIDEAVIMAVSGTQGNITITANAGVFDPTMVGALVYMEEKELRGIKPWASAEKNVPLGSLRRSDQKVYKAVSVPTVAAPDYYITGSTRPTHSTGRAFDGPQDVKSDGVDDYTVGVEWEFVHNTFGIVQITSVISSLIANATVIERIPDSIVGTVPGPAFGPFLFVGDGVTTTFATPGITSDNPVDFKVLLGGEPQQSNPNYPGGGGVAGGGGGNPRPGNDERGPIQAP